jgi:predicted RNase H-like HicB family nuclease
MAWCPFIVAVREQDGQVVVSVPDLPGCECSARTREEALGLIHHFVADYLSNLRAHGKPVPPQQAPIVHHQETAFSNAVWYTLDVWL